MRRFFITIFVLSLLATAGTWYWRTYLPEESASASAPATRGLSGDQAPGAPSAGGAPAGEGVASARQDLAVTISIWSSVISAIAAVLQTLLTARAIRR
jgi:hypothetical protein